MAKFGLSIDEYKIRIQQQIDDKAEEVRGRFLTLGSGMTMVYEQKLRETDIYFANPNVADYEIPHISTEAQIRGITNQEMAISILRSAAEWTELSKYIEVIRIGSKNAVVQTTTAIEARTILENALAQLDIIKP